VESTPKSIKSATEPWAGKAPTVETSHSSTEPTAHASTETTAHTAVKTAAATLSYCRHY
jgi:hypothetical protein